MAARSVLNIYGRARIHARLTVAGASAFTGGLPIGSGTPLPFGGELPALRGLYLEPSVRSNPPFAAGLTNFNGL